MAWMNMPFCALERTSIATQVQARATPFYTFDLTENTEPGAATILQGFPRLTAW